MILTVFKTDNNQKSKKIPFIYGYIQISAILYANMFFLDMYYGNTMFL